MSGLRYAAIGAAFEALSISQLPRLVRAVSSSKGVIFTLHRVLPEPPQDFSPNAILQVTPDFLRYAIRRVRKLGLDIVTLDEALRRVEDPGKTAPFVVFTFDDGYRDNLVHALPVLRAESCPFTLYVPTALVDGVGELWWQALEDIVQGQDGLALGGGPETEYFETRTTAEKQRAYDTLYWRMRKMPEPERLAFMRELARLYGHDLEKQCRDLIMDWRELATFASDPLCTIGAHTVHHYELAKLPEAEARNEILQSMRVLEAQFGKLPAHLSYPLGGPLSAGGREYVMARELGLRSAVTTKPGGLYHRHAQQLHALPRVSLNGLFQSRRFVDVFATGALTGRN
jgi:peptidoglycan/xylan/chitin deacetylase (PgdA/CDA1 family)